MLRTDEAEHIFRPWSREEDLRANDGSRTTDKTYAIKSEAVLDLSTATPFKRTPDFPSKKDLCSRENSLNFDSSDRKLDIASCPVEGIKMETPRTHMSSANLNEMRTVLSPALLQQLQFQAYLQSLHFQLLSMAKGTSGAGNIKLVHHQAFMNAQLQYAKSQASKPQDATKYWLPEQCKYPMPHPQMIGSPHPLAHSQQCRALGAETQKNNVNSFPLPSAKDGEPLDLLPKSLYLNKSQGGHLCIFCGKVYSRKYGLKIHLRTHTGYKPLKCKVCARPFGDPSNLNKHIRLHAEGDTPYRCVHCGKVLVRRRDLDRHIRSRHPQEATYLPPEEDTECAEDGDDVHETFSEQFMEQDSNKIEELDVVG